MAQPPADMASSLTCQTAATPNDLTLSPIPLEPPAHPSQCTSLDSQRDIAGAEVNAESGVQGAPFLDRMALSQLASESVPS
ncbi:hypothetical protein SARC_16831, partial [Sphaeroforma arctica JP610]